MTLPPVENFPFLIDFLKEFGPAITTADTLVPVSFNEMGAWLEVSGYDLTSWELLTLRELSVIFTDQYLISKDPNEPAPYVPLSFDRVEVASRVKQFFRAMMAQNGKRRKK